MKNEKQKNKNFFGSEKSFGQKSFFLQNLFKSQGFQRLEMKNEKIKTKTFFWSIILDFFQPEFQNEKIKFFFALGQKWKMKNEKQKT